MRGPARVLLLVYIAGLGAYTQFIRVERAEPRAAELASIPLALPGYSGVDKPLDQETLEVLGADEALFREYRTPQGRTVWLFAGYFGWQKENSQIHSPKHCYPGAGWSIHDEAALEMTGYGGPVRVMSLLIRNGNETQIVLYWFHTDQGIVSNEFELKWVQMKRALLRKSQRATFVRLSAGVEGAGDLEAARADIEAFAREIGPYLAAAIDGGGSTS